MSKNTKVGIGLLFLCLVFAPFASSYGFDSGISDGDSFGFPQEVVTIDYVINASNHFDYWDTTEGDLKDVSDISHSWLSDLGWSVAGHIIDTDFLPDASLSYDLGSGAKRWDWLYVRNISSENIDTYNVDALNNITAGDYFIGDGSLLTNVNITGQETDPLWTSNQSSYSTKAVADTLYYDLGNSYGYYNSTSIPSYVTSETDPLWTGNQSSYSTTAEIIGFNYWNDTFATFNKTYADTLYYDLGNSYGYYNSTDFDISDYYLKSNPYSFYNSSDFSISDYFTSLEVEGFNYYNSTDFIIGDYYLKSNPYSYINNSNLIDNSIANTLHRHSELVASDGTPDPALSVIANGNVGIGTTNPSSPLNVYVDNSDTTAPMVRLEQDGTGDTSVYYMLTGSHDFSTGIDNTDNNFKFAEGADLGTNTRMTIQTSTGNVGIGTASPDEKLQIDGNFTSETNATDSIGTLAIQWLNGFFVDLFVSNDLEVGGDVNVTGYIGGKNYVTQYHKNATIDTTSADTWVNISWDLTIDEETTSGYSLTDSNVSITIENTGIYRIQGCLHPKNNGVGNQEASLYSRILINEVEAKCLQFANSKEFKTTGIDTMPFTGTLYAEAGQKVQLQYYVTSTNIDFEGDSVFDDGVAGSINFERISK